MKKLFYILGVTLLCFVIAGCGSEKANEENVHIDGTLPEIMSKLYEGISEDELPMMLNNIELNDENFKYYAFADVDYKEAIASEGISSIAHSVVLIRLNNESDAKSVVEEIDKNADSRKWICVEAENVYVLSKGDLVVLIMANELAPKIKANFENLK